MNADNGNGNGTRRTRAVRSRASIAFATVAVVVTMVLAVVGSQGSGPASEPLGRADTVVLITIPGLRWQDLIATETPVLDGLLGHAATMSVRAAGPRTTPLEGYLTVGAGNRIEAAPSEGADLALVNGRCLPSVLASARQSADDELSGAEPGALGDRLADEGVPTAVHGSVDAIGALMDSDGCVDRYDAQLPASVGPGVTLLELGGLHDTDVAAERTAALASIDARLAAVELPSTALVIVFAPAAPFDRAEVVVVGVRRPGAIDGFGSLVSPTTRRADYVTLPDIAPAVLAASGAPDRDVPESMNGTEMRATTTQAPDRIAHEADLADLGERIVLRDRAVGPVSVVLIVLIVLCAFSALARRHRMARTLAPIVIAYPSVAFALGLVAYHQLPLNFVVVMVTLIATVIASIAVSSMSRFGPWAPVGGLAVLLWVLMVVDICTGGSLQINTPLGYSPSVAGRFQGFGNLAFGLVGASAVCAVAITMHVFGRSGLTGPDSMQPLPVPPVPASWVAATVGLITALAVALPAFGSDVGGTLAIVPTFAVIVPMVAGRRVGWKPLLLTGVAAVVVVAGLAVADLARPASSRTHLGRFLDDLLNGDGGLVVRRKMRANLAILTSSFWSFVLIGAVALLAVAVWRRREALLPVVRARPPLRVFLVGFAVVAFLGFALNDSGLAVPAIMGAVVVPWLVASLVPVVKRAGR